MIRWSNRFGAPTRRTERNASCLTSGCARSGLNRLKPFYLLSLVVFFSFVLAAPEQASAQDAQLITTELKISCSGAEYGLAFVSANGRLQDQTTAKALGVTLIPKKGRDSIRVFCFYRFDAQGGPQLRRDDTLNLVGKALLEYSPGKLAEFFNNKDIACSIPDKTANAIRTFLENSPGEPSATEAVSKLGEDTTTGISNKGTEQGALEPAGEFANQVAFANAIRGYVSRVAAPENEIDVLKQEIQKLRNDMQHHREDIIQSQESLLSYGYARITWLLLLLVPATLFLACFVPLTHWLARKRSAPQEATPGLQAENTVQKASNDLPPDVTAKLQDIFQQFIHNLELSKEDSQSTRKTIFLNLQAPVLSLTKSYGAVEGANSNRKSETGKRLNEILINSYQEFESKKTNKQLAVKIIKDLYAELRQVCIESLPAAIDTQAGGSTREPAVENLSAESLAYAKQVDIFLASFTGQAGMIPTIEGVRDDFKEIWSLCSTPEDPFPRDSLRRVVGKSKETLLLFRDISRQFNDGGSSQETRKSIERFFNDLRYIQRQHLQSTPAAASPEEILIALKDKLASDKKELDLFAELTRKINDTKALFDKLHGYGDGDLFQRVRRLAEDHQKAGDLLSGYRAGKGQNLTEIISMISGDFTYIRDLLKPDVTDPEGTLREKARELVKKYHDAKAEAQQADELRRDRDSLQTELTTAKSQLVDGEKLIELVSGLLHFNNKRIAEDAKPIAALLSRMEGEPDRFKQLRLRLSAAVLTLTGAIQELEAHGRKDIILALKVPYIKKNLEGLLLNMEDSEREGRFSQEVEQAFARNWLHDLFRADLLLCTYFSENESASPTSAMTRRLQDALVQAGSALNMVISEFGYTIINVSLLEPSPEGVEREGTYKELRELPEVKERIKREINDLTAKGTLSQAVRDKKVVVDVFSFPFKFGNGRRASGRVATLNPSDWL